MEEFNYSFNLTGIKKVEPLPKNFAEIEAQKLVDKIINNMKKEMEKYDFIKEE